MESEAKERWSKLGRCSTVDLENAGRDHLLRNMGSFWKLGKARNQILPKSFREEHGPVDLDSRPKFLGLVLLGLSSCPKFLGPGTEG